MITSDLLVSRFNVALDHKTLNQSMKFRIYYTAVKNFFCNTNLLVILFIRVGVVSINNNSRILKVLFLIFLPEKTKIFVVIIRNSFPVFVYGTAKNCVCKLISCCLYFPASVNKTMSALSCNNRVKHNCKVTTGRVFIPAGTSIPLTVRRCC